MAPKADALARVKKRAHRPSKKVTYRRYCFYGKNKKGKSTLGVSGGPKKTLVLDPEAVVARCQQRLAEFKRPRVVKIVTDFPKTPIGKIQKNLLREPYWRDRDKKI